MKLTSMKMTKKESTILGEVSSEAPAYPYGLQIELNNEALKKLGLKELPEAGESVMIHAMATVSRASSTETTEGGKQQSVSLQITDLMIMEEDEEEEGMEDKLYG